MKRIYIPLTILLFFILQGCTVNYFSLNKSWSLVSTKYTEIERPAVTFKLKTDLGFYTAEIDGLVTLGSPPLSHNISILQAGVKLGATTIYFPGDIPFSALDKQYLMLKKGYYYVEIKGDKMYFYETPDEGLTKGELALEFKKLI